ncbi:MAG TPA: iron ABC transporter permease [Candidatus Poseidoniales archaeon]|nr:MAG TPA: iron ABC transporter permease [Candidatus Poseidoniales archaeon]
MPFVTPTIVAAMGFLAIIGKGGLNLIGNEGYRYMALILAHAWFNIALIIRFVEPVISRVHPSMEEQLKFLQMGRTSYHRIRYLWIPILWPSILSGAILTFTFSFTSFAMIRWITPGNQSLESFMAIHSSGVGIPGYLTELNQLILAAFFLQLTILIIGLAVIGILQKKLSSVIPHIDEKFEKPKPRKVRFILYPALIFVVIPLVSVIVGSFRIQDRTKRGTYFWGLDGWKRAINGSYAHTDIIDATMQSLVYASMTVIFAVPLGLLITKSLIALEKRSNHKARVAETFLMLPFCISAVMIGLGILIGFMKWQPDLMRQWWIPVLPHIIIATPFVIRIFLSTYRSIDSDLIEHAKTLGLSHWAMFWNIEWHNIRPPLIVASLFCAAISLGEFGASWMLARDGSFDTLSVLIDQIMSKPGFDPLTYPTAMAVATVLMTLTLSFFTIAEKWREEHDGGGF